MIGVVATAVAGFVGFYAQYLLKNKRQDDGVRRQVMALMQACMRSTLAVSRQSSYELHDANVQPVRLLAERLVEKDVASALDLDVLDKLMSLQTMCWHFLESVEAYNDYTQPGNQVRRSLVDSLRTSAQRMAYMLYQKLHLTLSAMGGQPSSLKPMPEWMQIENESLREEAEAEDDRES